MKRFALGIFCLLFIIACAKEELPPSPSQPGDGIVAGRAIGGAPISPSTMPKWAAPMLYTDISPTAVKTGDTVKVTIEKPATVKTKFYAYAVMYAYNKKFKIWEKALASPGDSGKITKDWAENKAVFYIPVSAERFLPGMNYLVTYWCFDTEKRDKQGFKVWNCNGQKWGLGGFEVAGERWPDILIEKDIENNRYKDSVKSEGSWGTEYIAKYQHINGIKTDVSVLQLKNVNEFKLELLEDGITTLEQLWTKRGNVCGFLKVDTGKAFFGWLSGSKWLTVMTHANIIDDAKVGVYGIKYPSDCGLLDVLKALAQVTVGVCGNGKVDAAVEECDKAADTACPGACKPDCKCASKGPPNVGFCGDLFVNVPNSNSVNEQCEPPGVRDPVTGQLISTPCFVRDASGKIVGAGACNDKCACESVPFIESRCGDGNAGPGEQCGEPGKECAAGQKCVDCLCEQLPCGNGKIEAGEECGEPALNCAEGKKCENCLCKEIPVPVCGDGKSDAGEQCGEPGLTCSAGQQCENCACKPIAAVCGDGVIQAPEVCETVSDCGQIPNAVVGCSNCQCTALSINPPSITCGDAQCSPGETQQNCPMDCGQPQPVARCGDGVIGNTPGEQCDDGNTANNDGCSAACRTEVCGDGVVQAGRGEQCEPPNTQNCDASCKDKIGNFLCSCGFKSCFASSCSAAGALSACQSFGVVCSQCTLFSTGPVTNTGGATLITGCVQAQCPPTAECDPVLRRCPMGSTCSGCRCINLLGILSEPEAVPVVNTRNALTGLATENLSTVSKSSQIFVVLLAALGILIITLLNFLRRED